MSKSAVVDIRVGEFETVKNHKLFNLENYKKLEFKIPIKDRYGRVTEIYTQI